MRSVLLYGRVLFAALAVAQVSARPVPRFLQMDSEQGGMALTSDGVIATSLSATGQGLTSLRREVNADDRTFDEQMDRSVAQAGSAASAILSSQLRERQDQLANIDSRIDYINEQLTNAALECVAFTNCAQCTQSATCVWCPSTNTCVAGDGSGPVDASAECEAYEHGGCQGGCSQYTICASCTSQDNCAWCESSQFCVETGVLATCEQWFATNETCSYQTLGANQPYAAEENVDSVQLNSLRRELGDDQRQAAAFQEEVSTLADRISALSSGLDTYSVNDLARVQVANPVAGLQAVVDQTAQRQVAESARQTSTDVSTSMDSIITTSYQGILDQEGGFLTTISTNAQRVAEQAAVQAQALEEAQAQQELLREQNENLQAQQQAAQAALDQANASAQAAQAAAPEGTPAAEEAPATQEATAETTEGTPAEPSTEQAEVATAEATPPTEGEAPAPDAVADASASTEEVSSPEAVDSGASSAAELESVDAPAADAPAPAAFYEFHHIETLQSFL